MTAKIHGADFGDTRLSFEDARERYALVTRLSTFVEQGLRDIDGRQKVKFSPFRVAVSAKFTDTLASGYRDSKMTPADARARACRAFLECYKAMAERLSFTDVRPPVVVGWDEELRAIEDAYGPDKEVEPEGATAKAAYEQAKQNLQRARSRLLVLYCLGGHLPRMQEASSRDSAECQAYDAASLHLWEQASTFEKHQLMLAVLLGGEALEKSRAKLLTDHFTPGHSLIQWLSRDGILPSRWPSSVESDFLVSVLASARACGDSKPECSNPRIAR